MRPCFHPRLVNDPFGDPALFVPHIYQKRALLFDLGDLAPLAARDILKVRDVFVTHAHMDHFCGFDRLLRLFLGRGGELRLYGPQGFLENVAGKLAGYTWNLMGNYARAVDLRVSEVGIDAVETRIFRGRQGFRADPDGTRRPFDGLLVEEPCKTVSAAILDHGTPCLGFRLQEPFHVNMRPEVLREMGLTAGPWIERFKQALFARRPPDELFRFGERESRRGAWSLSLGELARRAARITAGQCIAYVADVGYDQRNARGADRLYIEAAFLDAERGEAARKNHLTARQAGELAARAGVGEYRLFHFSPRYRAAVPAGEFARQAREGYRAGSGRQ